MGTDDEKTRVLQRRPAAPAAALPAGKIAFHCSNGHRIIAAASLAGKQGQCSKCGIDVTIPAATGAAAGPVGGAAVAGPEIPVEPPPVPAPPGEPVAETAAPTETETAAATEADPPAGEGAASGETWDFIGAQAGPPAEGFEADPWGAVDAGGLAVEAGNPTAVLVGRLWAERQHGGIIELHLSGGGVILPEWYDVNWSRGTHGLFASQAADGSVTLTAVAWDTVQKIVVRQLTEVPHDMFA